MVKAGSEIEVHRARRRGKRYIIELVSGDQLRLSEEIVFKYSVFGGARFDPERWLGILREAWVHECYRKILGMISRRPHTEKELRLKLFQKGYDREVVDQALAKAAELGLLDDGHFARLFVEEKLLGGRYGRRRIEAELRRRGVEWELIQAAFEQFAKVHGENAEWENILTAAKRKWQSLVPREKDLRKRRHKLLAFLANRGYDAELCFRVVDIVTRKNSGTEQA